MKADEKLLQIKNSCTITKKVLHAFFVIMLVGVIGCIIGAGTCGLMRTRINKELKAAIESGHGSVEIKSTDILGGIVDLDVKVDELMDKEDYALVFVIYCSIGIVYCAFLSVIFFILSKIFEIIPESETPFCKTVLEQFKKLFVIVTVLVLFGSGLGEALVTGLIFWCVYRIFEYGIIIQTEVDETL